MADDGSITRDIQYYPNAELYAGNPDYVRLVRAFIAKTEEAVRASDAAHEYAMKYPSDTAGRTERNRIVQRLDAEREGLYSRIEKFGHE